MSSLIIGSITGLGILGIIIVKIWKKTRDYNLDSSVEPSTTYYNSAILSLSDDEINTMIYPDILWDNAENPMDNNDTYSLDNIYKKTKVD